MTKLTTKEKAQYREELAGEQGGLCKLCVTALEDDKSLDHCFTGETEIMTEDGFVRFDELEKDVKVFQYHFNGTTDLVLPLNYIEYEYKGDLVYLHKLNYSSLTTPQHRLPLVSDDFYSCTAEDLPISPNIHRDKNIPKVSKYIGGKGIPLTDDEIRFMVMFQADGCFTTGLRFRFRRKEKIQRFEELMGRLEIPYTTHNTDAFQAYIGVDDSPQYASKIFVQDLTYFTKRQLEVFIDEVSFWDSSSQSNGFQYSTTVKENRDYVRFAATLAGYSGTEWTKVRSGNHQALHYATVTEPRKSDSIRNTKKEIVPYEGQVYCVEVPSSYIVVKHEGLVSISGNCHTEGNCRAVLHRWCNAQLGRIENAARRNGKTDHITFLENCVALLKEDHTRKPYHPTHKNDIEKQIAKIKRRMAKCKTKRGKQKNKDLINKLREQV